MRKLFELFLSFFRPVPKDVVNTGYMTEDINDVLDAHDRRVEKQMSDRGDDSFCIR